MARARVTSKARAATYHDTVSGPSDPNRMMTAMSTSWETRSSFAADQAIATAMAIETHGAQGNLSIEGGATRE